VTIALEPVRLSRSVLLDVIDSYRHGMLVRSQGVRVDGILTDWQYQQLGNRSCLSGSRATSGP
jgi:hypothetical protein